MSDFVAKNEHFAAVVAQAFADQTMMVTLGASLSEVVAGSVTITSTIPACTLQHQGIAHAGLAFSIGDSAAGFSAITLLPAGMTVVTSEMKIHLLAPGTGDRLVAVGRVLRPGSRMMVCESEVWAETGDKRNLIAKMIGTMVPLPAT